MDDIKSEWHFFLDESGQEQKESPQIVFGGFGIDKTKFEDFKADIEAAYFDAFGYPLSDKSEELKGKSLLKKKEFKEAALIPKLSDEERKELIAKLRTKSSNSGFSFKMRPAKGQASLMFVDSVFKILKKYDCYVIGSITTSDNYDKSNYRFQSLDKNLNSTQIDNFLKYIQAPSGVGLKTHHLENFTTYMINDLENLTYRAIFDFSNYKSISKLEFFVDKSSTKQDRLRQNHFIKIFNEFNPYIKQENIDINFVDSDNNLGISIADIIIYCLNFGLYYYDDIGDYINQNKNIMTSLRSEINELILKHLQPDHYENDFFNLARLSRNIDSQRIRHIIKKP